MMKKIIRDPFLQLSRKKSFQLDRRFLFDFMLVHLARLSETRLQTERDS